MASKKIKEIKHFNSSNEYDSTPIGCDAENVDMADGSTLEETITDLKKSVSDGKTAVANAITDKGVETATDAEFATMAENISKIESGSGGGINIFTQETEPDKKEGIWIQTPNPYNDIVVGNSTYSNPTTEEWVLEDTLPPTTFSYSVFLFNDILYGFYSCRLYKFDGAEWVLHSNVSSSCSTIVVYNNEMHVFGGSYHLKYNGRTWETVSNLPKSFTSCQAVVYNSEIHILGLYQQSNYDASIIHYYQSHYVYRDNTWVLITAPSRFLAFPIVYNNEIHMLGGYCNPGKNSSLASGYTNIHYKFDGTEWVQVSVLPSSFNYKGIVYKNELYAFKPAYSNFYKYNSDNNEWEELKSAPFYLYNAIEYNGKIHTFVQSKHYSITFDEIDNVTGQTVAIYQNTDNDTGTYSTNLLDGIPITGKNNKFPSGFDNVYYLDSDGYVEKSPTYYGDGTQWVKFKN